MWNVGDNTRSSGVFLHMSLKERFFRVLPRPACLTTKQNTVEASLLVKYGSKKFLVQRNSAALWFMKKCTLPMEITKQRAQSLRMKIRNAELYLTGATKIILQLVTRFLDLASKLERLNCFHWFSDYRREYYNKLSTDHSSGQFCDWHVSLRLAPHRKKR